MSKIYATEGKQYDVISSALSKLEAFIRPTYGPGGRGILVDQGLYQKILDDGFLVIDEFELPDPLENAVIKFVREASARTNKRAGDGTTTATLLMIALVKEFIRSGKSRHKIFEELSVGAEEARGQIHQTIRLIDSLEDLRSVAFNAYRDSDSATIVSQAVKDVGPDGVITVQEGESLSTTAKVVQGMSIPQGFYSPYLANQEQRVEIEDPYILLTTRRLKGIEELLPILKRVSESGNKKLLIVCEEIEGEALTTVIMNRLQGRLDVMAVKAPYRDVAKKDFLDDLAAVTGATVADDAKGMQLENLGLGALGHAEKVVITKDETLIVGAKGNVDAVVESVREQLKAEPHNDAIQKRLARLVGGIGVIKVGAHTEAEMKTKKAKIEDAVNATQLAYKTGVVAGGGQAFLVDTSSYELNTALQFPRLVLKDNGMEALDDNTEDAYGVVEAALDSAISMATLLLNCGGIITKNEKESVRSATVSH
jgi:chaperonin GroEL